MNKLKKGDEVIVHPDKNGNTMGIKKENLGKSVITGIYGDGIYRVRKIENDFDLGATEDMLTLAAPTQKIVITTDGKETLARLYENDKVIRRATAKCSPRDEFDFQTGAKIAFERLVGEAEREPEPDPLNGKFVAVEQIPKFVPMTCICVGKVVTFKDGYDVSGNIPVCYNRIERTKVNGSYGGSLTNTGFRFIKVEEEEKRKELEYLTGKVICVRKDVGPQFTVGKVYAVESGRVTDDTGWEFSGLLLENIDMPSLDGYADFVRIKED